MNGEETSASNVSSNSGFVLLHFFLKRKLSKTSMTGQLEFLLHLAESSAFYDFTILHVITISLQFH